MKEGPPPTRFFFRSFLILFLFFVVHRRTMAENSEIKMWNFVISVQQLMENVDERNSNLRFFISSIRLVLLFKRNKIQNRFSYKIRIKTRIFFFFKSKDKFSKVGSDKSNTFLAI